MMKLFRNSTNSLVKFQVTSVNLKFSSKLIIVLIICTSSSINCNPTLRIYFTDAVISSSNNENKHVIPHPYQHVHKRDSFQINFQDCIGQLGCRDEDSLALADEIVFPGKFAYEF